MTDLSIVAKLSPTSPSTRCASSPPVASLFDGHDASINIMRRILQSTGVEVIHLGHNRFRRRDRQRRASGRRAGIAILLPGGTSSSSST